MGNKWFRGVVFVVILAVLFAGYTKIQASGLSANPSQVNVGDQIQVSWQIDNPTGNDWISMHNASDQDDSKVLTWQRIGGGNSGTLSFQASGPGQYQFRFFSNGPKIASSNVVTVVAPQQQQPQQQQNANVQPVNPNPPVAPQDPGNGQASLSVLPTSVGPGGNVNVSWNNSSPSGNDWVSMHQQGGSDSIVIAWQKANGNSGQLSFQAPIVIGNYDFRFFRNGNKTGTSNGYSVVGGVQPPVNPPTVTPVPQPPATCNGVRPPHLKLGQQATVTAAGNGHALRAGDGISQPVESVVSQGLVVVVTGGPRCTDNYNWWQVQTPSQGTWWIAEADGSNYFLDNGSNPNPQPAQPVQPQQPQQQASVVPCSEGGVNMGMNDRTSGFVLTSYILNPFTTEGQQVGGQCTDFVINYFRQHYSLDLTNWNNRSCVGSSNAPYSKANAQDWASAARNFCGWPVDVNPIIGSIVVWQSYCPTGGKNKDGTIQTVSSVGHVAVLTGTGGNSITVDESNWDTPEYPDGDNRIHLGTRYIIEGCISFIHVPGTTGAENVQQNQSNQVNGGQINGYQTSISLTGCQPGAWVSAMIPSGYSIAVLHSVYDNGAQQQWSQSIIGMGVNGGKVRFILNFTPLNQLANKVGCNKLQDPSAWYVTVS